MQPSVDLEALKRHPGALRLYGQKLRLEKRGTDYFALCPFHREKSPSFSVYQKDNVWLWTCFGCPGGSGTGNIIQFVEKTQNVTFKEAIAIVQKELGDSGSSWESTREVDAVFHSVAAEPKEYRTLTLAQIAPLERDLAASPAAQKWLRDVRGISLETAQRLHVGFKQDLGSVARGESPEVVSGGWIAFPCVDGDKVLGIKFRSIIAKSFRRQPGMATTLYNLDTVDPLDPLYVVEGELDCAALEQAGFHAVSLPSASTTLTPEMKDQIMAADTVILAGDCDGGVGSQIMERLYKDLGDRTYLLKWPEGKKDANQAFLESSGGDVSSFRTLVEQLTVDAKGNPMPEFTSIQKALTSGTHSSIIDHPHRLRFPWDEVDRMAVLLPGSVLALSATNSGMGKTQWVNQLALACCRKQSEVVVSYQVELSAAEIANITAAHITRKERNSLTEKDNHDAARVLKDAQYFVGNDPTLNTATAVLDLLEKAIRRLGATVVILDHIHALCRGDNELRDQAEASRRIKTLAQTYHVKFIVVAQPRKADSKSKGKSLHITDIKGSAAIIEDADALFVLHRNYIQNPDPNNPPMDTYEPETEVHCLKARSKGTGSAFSKLFFHGALATFADISHMEPPPQ